MLSADQALAASRKRREGGSNTHLIALYSSYHGGIITDPALMALPLDDHMVGRGHGMFDTGSVKNGRFYRLGAHLDRMLGNASKVIHLA